MYVYIYTHDIYMCIIQINFRTLKSRFQLWKITRTHTLEIKFLKNQLKNYDSHIMFSNNDKKTK